MNPWAENPLLTYRFITAFAVFFFMILQQNKVVFLVLKKEFLDNLG
jgi:hypothetical protein